MKRRTWWSLAASIALLALAASATGLPNQYAYDDVFAVQKDTRLHTLVHWWHLLASPYWSKEWGGDGYRPLTILGFAIQWVVGHGSPLLFHSVNVVLYMAMCVAVFWVMTGVLPKAPAWIAAALFAVHPVHVEAVANVVGQSELTTGLLLCVGMALYVYGRANGPLTLGRQIAIGACYAGAMLFKEHGIVLVALVVVAEMTVVRDPRPLWTRLVAMRPFVLALTALAVAYLWARSVVLPGNLSGFHPFVPFQGLHLSTPNRILTMIGVAPVWGRLFLWPAHLSTEYAPPYVDIAQGPSITQLPGLLLMVGVVGLAFALRKRNPAASFGLGWLIVAMSPVSNIVLPAGFLIAERTLLFPSVGVMIFIGALIPPAYAWLAERRLQYAGAAAVAALLVAGTWRSAMRQKVWHDDDVLFKTAVKDAPDSYRAHFMLGAWYMENKRMRDGEAEYRRGMQLFQFDPFMAFSFAEDYRKWGICKPAIQLYRWAISIDSNTVMGRPQIADCLLLENKFDSAKVAAVTAVRHGASVEDMHRILVWADSAKAYDAAHAKPASDSGETPRLLHEEPPDTGRRTPPPATIGR
jgi:protein O-mannosyl-transferase